MKIAQALLRLEDGTVLLLDKPDAHEFMTTTKALFRIHDQPEPEWRAIGPEAVRRALLGEETLAVRAPERQPAAEVQVQPPRVKPQPHRAKARNGTQRRS